MHSHEGMHIHGETCQGRGCPCDISDLLATLWMQPLDSENVMFKCQIFQKHKHVAKLCTLKVSLDGARPSVDSFGSQ